MLFHQFIAWQITRFPHKNLFPPPWSTRWQHNTNLNSIYVILPFNMFCGWVPRIHCGFVLQAEVKISACQNAFLVDVEFASVNMFCWNHGVKTCSKVLFFYWVLCVVALVNACFSSVVKFLVHILLLYFLHTQYNKILDTVQIVFVIILGMFLSSKFAIYSPVQSSVKYYT